MKIYKLCAAIAIVCATSRVSAATLTTEASNNATVRPDGPRSGSSGKAFFNVEGSGNGSNASYGVADFDFSVPVPAVNAINSVKIQLIQSNAFFTADGPVLFSLDTSSSLANIEPVTSPLAFDGDDPGTDDDVNDGDLDLEAFSGTFNFVEGSSGDVDEYMLGLSPAIESELISRLNAGQPIRIVIGTGSASVAATWAGHTNSTFAGPTLVLDVGQVPEPATIGLTLVGLLGVVCLRKRIE